MKKIGLLVCLLGMLSGIAACGSDGGEDLSLAECNYTPHRLDWDEVSPDGTVPADLLAFAEFTNASLPATLGPEEDETTETISFTVSRRGTFATYQEGQNCPSRLEIPLLVSFATNDSDTFDETFEVTAIEQDSGLVVSHIFQPEDLVGDFAPEVHLPNARIYQLSLTAVFRPGVSGNASVGVHIEQTQGDSVSSHVENRWSWAW